MNNKIKIYLGMGFLASILFVFILLQAGNQNDLSRIPSQNSELGNSGERSENVFANWGSNTFDSFFLEKSKEIYQQDGSWLKESEIFHLARKGELDLVSELWAFRRKCPKDYTDDQCHTLVRTFLLDQYGEGDLVRLFDKYTKFEREIASMVPPEMTSPKERYEWMKDVRRKFFNTDEIQLIFGMEESLTNYSLNRESFLKRTKDLPPEKRIQEYESYRKKELGNYFDVVNRREPAFQKYDREMELRSDSMARLSADERDRIEREVRSKYFDKAAVERMEKALQEIKKEEEILAKVKSEEDEFRRKNPQVSGEKLDQELMKIRVNRLGKDAAEEYSRRLQYETNLKSLDSQSNVR
jgi:hypothetical protein